MEGMESRGKGGDQKRRYKVKDMRKQRRDPSANEGDDNGKADTNRVCADTSG